jgi:iron-sulfur cluster repair protein YtfE (RIC family)
MQSLTTVLERHHRECDALLADAQRAVADADWALSRTRFDAFRAALAAHFEAEETVLFPRFEAVTGTIEGPTRVMRSEHAAMRDALSRMAEALAGEDADGFSGENETLFLLMQQHNLKEEGVLYPMCDLRLVGESAALGAAITRCVEGAPA